MISIWGYIKASAESRNDRGAQYLLMPYIAMGFKGDNLLHTVQCRVGGGKAGRTRCSVKALEWVTMGVLQVRGEDGLGHCLVISPFFRMICRCQGASLVSS